MDVTNLPGDKDAWGAAATFGDGDAVITDSFAVELLRKAARDQFPARTEGPLPLRTRSALVTHWPMRLPWATQACHRAGSSAR